MSDYSISAKITADASGFQTAITKATSALDNFGKDFSNSTKEISTGLKKWGVDFDAFYNKGSSIFKSFGVDIDQFASNFGMSGKLMSGIVAVTTALNKLGEEVNKVTSQIVKGTGATGTALSQLENTAKDAMLKGIGDSAEDVGKIIANLNTRFGVTGDKAVQLAKSFDSLSEVMGVDASDSVNSVADALKKWGLGAQDANIFLDKLTVASQQTGASFSELLSGLTSGQAIFSQFGMTINDSIAFLGGLSSEGLNTESAITGLRTALNNFAKDGENAADGLERVTDEIRNAKSQTEAMRIATETFGSRAGAEMLKVIQSESSAIADLTEKLKDASGALAKTDEASRTAKDAWKDLMISLESVFGSFGQGVNDMIRDIIDSFRNLVELITPIIQPIAETFRWVFSTVGYVVKTATSSLLDFFDTETEVERIGKLTNQVYEEQAEAVATLRQEVRKLDEAEREREKNSLMRQMAGESTIINQTKRDIKDLTAEYERYMAITTTASDELSYDENVYAEAAQKERDLLEQISNLNAVLELHQTKYNGLAEQIKVFTDIEEEEADTRIQTAKREAEQKELAQKEAYLKMADYIESFGDKEIAQNIKIAQQKMQNEIQTLKNIEAGEAQIAAVRQKYTAEINGYLIDQINNEEKAELAKVEALEKIIGVTDETEELRKTITQYYANERKQIETDNVEAVIKVIDKEKKAFAKAEQEKIELIEETTEKALESKQQNYSWDIRLLEQQKAAADTDEKRKEIQKQIYELQRKQALVSADINDYAKINEYYDNLIKDLTESRAKTMGKVAEEEEQASQSAEKAAEAKATNYSWDLKLLQLDLEEATRAKEKERIQKEIYEMQREEALARADIADHAKINEYYDRLIKGLIQDQNEALEEQAELYEDVDNSRNGGEKSATPNKEAEVRAAAMQKLAEMEQSWNDKLLSQKIALAESERQLDSQTYEAQAYHIDRILKLKQEQLETERQAALANVEDTEENASLRASIEKYYDNESAQMYRESLVEKEKYRAKDVKEEQSLWDKTLAVAKKAVNGMKTVASGISDIFKGVFNAVGKLWSGFVDMLDFNPDDALIGLLEFEDKVLTFFYETLPKIPAFLAAAFQSVVVLLDTVFENVDFGGLFDAVANTVSELFKKLPAIIKKTLPKFMNALKTIFKSFITIVPDLIQVGNEIIELVFAKLPTAISEWLPSLIQALVGFIPQLFGVGSALVVQIAKALPTLLDGILKAFIAILNNPSQIRDLVSALTNALIALIKTVLTNLPALITGLTSVITEVLKAIPDIIVNLLTDPEVWKQVGIALLTILVSPINAVIDLLNKIPFVDIPHLNPANWFEDGTNSAPRGLAVVGEAGPELVNFRGGEKVYNNTNTEKMLAGAKGGNTFNVTFNNTVDTSAYQMMRQLKQYNRELAFNSVI